MLRGFSLGRVLPMLLVVMVVIAIYKANGGDLSNVVSSAWQLINTGAEFLLDLWNKFIGSGQAQSILSQTPAP